MANYADGMEGGKHNSNDTECSPSTIEIKYGRTAYVHGCTDEQLNLLKNDMIGWATGDDNVCITREEMISWLDEYAENCDIRTNIVTDEQEKLAIFLHETENKFEGEIGDIVFSM